MSTEQAPNTTSTALPNAGADSTATNAEDDGSMTVHPLEHQWTMWYDAPPPNRRPNERNFLNALTQVYTFDTVEQFWQMQNHIVQPRNLAKMTTYRLMREELNPPKWEHKLCENGGEWIVTIKHDGPFLKHLDDMWSNLCMACIGGWFEQFDDNLCGCNVASRKNEYRISIWTNTSDLTIAKQVGEMFKAFMETDKFSAPGDISIQAFFKTFKDMLAGKQDPLLVL